VLIAAMAWVALVRVPLVLNAESHLDSDLAVDGLTLRDAAQGRWRWHYPGTPHMGILPMFLSLPQALAWGANPRTLVSGGVVAFELVVLATFVMSWRVFGAAVASLGLIPLVFSSTGVIWLSGRITGGHLLTVAWSAVAFARLHAALSKPATWRAGVLGLWCGLGLYLDRMFLLVIASLAFAAVMGWWWSARPRRSGRSILVLAVGFVVGYLPHVIGSRVDPHDAYGEQFVSIFRPFGEPRPDAPIPWGQARALMKEHTAILLRECLPRLVAGHVLPTFESQSPAIPIPIPARGGASRAFAVDPITLGATACTLTLFVLALARLVLCFGCRADPAAAAIQVGLILVGLLVIAGFLLNRNIFNSDNYRYLVLLLLPHSVGVGLLLEGWVRRGRTRRVAAIAVALSLAVLLSSDTWRWYRERGWVKGVVPVRVAVHDPILEWLDAHPQYTAIVGDYWAVYRLAFLSERPLRAVPYPGAPLRFPEWSLEATAGPGRVHVRDKRGRRPGFGEADWLPGVGSIILDSPSTLIVEWP
jgi:hypothetical protein